MSHFLGCLRPDVYVHRGISHDLAACRGCGAQEWVNPR